jgi:hypothetical protein
VLDVTVVEVVFKGEETVVVEVDDKEVFRFVACDEDDVTSSDVGASADIIAGNDKEEAGRVSVADDVIAVLFIALDLIELDDETFETTEFDSC